MSFFLFFGSLGVFASFDGKLQTTSRKPNKNNKTNVFFVFSRFLLLLVENLEDTITCCETLIVRQSLF